MNKNVTIIPPSEDRPAILRVAAYCRVSTDSDDQATSYASQIRSYTELISQHEGWELVDIYADEAVSGTKTDKREDFNRLLADCRKGKIDRVLVKSISRFSRNTKDCLAALRELMRLGVTVQFEKENIDTGTLTTELMVSVSGSLAQQESMSISQNIHQSYRRRMERGEFITTKPPYGYRLVNRRELEIVPEEAEIIRWVFDAYLGGQSAKDIANELIRRGVRDRKGNVHWTTREIYYWLSNEKYVGDTLCQKTYKTGFPFVQKINRGEVDQFYVEGTHPAIVSQEVYDKAQALRQMKKKQSKGPDAVYPLSRKMCCGICGFTIYRRVTRRGTGAWSCGRHLRACLKSFDKREGKADNKGKQAGDEGECVNIQAISVGKSMRRYERIWKEQGKRRAPESTICTTCFVRWYMWCRVEYNGECCPAIIPNGKAFTTISGYGPKKMKRASVFWIRCCTNWSSRYGMKT